MKSTTTYEMHNYAANTMPCVDHSDANNNEATATHINSSGSEKYSLRQRQRRCIASTTTLTADSSGYLSDDAYNSEREDYESSSVTKTTRRARAKTASTRKKSNSANMQNSQVHDSATTKCKTKAAPLSKYRRKTANARERTRMREINSAFENLRHCVPHTITGDDSVQSSEKLTKITTLRLAMKYISILSEALKNPSFEADFLLECKRDGDHRFTTHNWQQEPLIASTTYDEQDEDEEELDIELEPVQQLKPKAAALKSKSKGGKTARAKTSTKHSMTQNGKTQEAGHITRKAPTKRQSKKQKLQQSTAPYSSHSSAASTCSTLSTSAYASLSSAASSIAAASPPCSSVSNSSYLLDSPVNTAYINNVSQSMTELSSLILESDGESLHLSEPCLSPSNYRLLGSCSSSSGMLIKTQQQHAATADVLNPFDQHMSMSSTLENPLELSLRLLDSSADSLDFAVAAVGVAADQHAPSTCLSPLITLDSFNPFADLLHSDFSEQSALDLFLT